MKRKSLVPVKYKTVNERLAYLQGYSAGLTFGQKLLKLGKKK